MRGTIIFFLVFFAGHHFGDIVIDAAKEAYNVVAMEVSNANR